MNAFTTINITRTRAKQAVFDAMLKDLDDPEKLKERLDEILAHRLYNCKIVNDNDQPNHDGLL